MAPSPAQIRTIFEPFSIQGRQQEFFHNVADDVHWTILGHSPLSGVYTKKSDFIRETVTYLGKKVISEPLRLKVVNVVSDGEKGDWATVEMVAVDARCRNGLVYDMNYCWVIKFNQDNIITTVRAYLDTKLLTDAIEQNS